MYKDCILYYCDILYTSRNIADAQGDNLALRVQTSFLSLFEISTQNATLFERSTQFATLF